MSAHKISLIFIILFFSTTRPFAAENNIVVLGTNHVPPFKIIDGQALKGINGDVLKEIFRDTGLVLKIRQCPWKRCLIELEDGKLDVFLGIFKTPEREKKFYFCEPPYKNRSDKAFYLRKGEAHRVIRYEDLYRYKIGVTRGYKNFERFDKDKKLKKEFVADHKLNIKMLLDGRIDVFIQTEVAADYLIKVRRLGDKIEKASYKHTKINPSYFIINRNSRYMRRINDFEKNLRRFEKEKKYFEIKKKWTR